MPLRRSLVAACMLVAAMATSPARIARSAPGPQGAAPATVERADAHLELTGVGRAVLAVGGVTSPAVVESMAELDAGATATAGYTIDVSVTRHVN